MVFLCASLCFQHIRVEEAPITHPFFVFSTFCQVFTVSKDLVPRVLSRVVEAVSEELSRLMQCVSSFSRNGALQVLCRCRARGLRCLNHGDVCQL